MEANQLSVKLELQADCFAGVWGHHAQRSRQILEQGDIEEALNAASSIGDDRLQSQAKGYVVRNPLPTVVRKREFAGSNVAFRLAILNNAILLG